MLKDDFHTEESLIKLPAIQNGIVPLSKTTIYRKIKEGSFPKPYKLTESGKSVAWKKSEILQWVAEQNVIDTGVHNV